MPIPSAILATVPLLLTLGTSASLLQAACTDEVQNRWLQGCLATVADSQQAANGLAVDTDRVFVAERDLAGSFVRLCEEKARQVLLAKYGWPPAAADGCSTEKRVEWLDACVQDARAIVPGSPRRAIADHFMAEGGFTEIGQTGFGHLRCSMLKIDVTFRLGGGPAESPDDVVQSVETYLGFTAFD